MGYCWSIDVGLKCLSSREESEAFCALRTTRTYRGDLKLGEAAQDVNITPIRLGRRRDVAIPECLHRSQSYIVQSVPSAQARTWSSWDRDQPDRSSRCPTRGTASSRSARAAMPPAMHARMHPSHAHNASGKRPHKNATFLRFQQLY